MLWTEEESEFEGEFCSFPKVRSYPKPVQNPHPPIIFGGESKPALKRVGEETKKGAAHVAALFLFLLQPCTSETVWCSMPPNLKRGRKRECKLDTFLWALAWLRTPR